MAEVYGNLVILVMEGVDRAALCPPVMLHRHALYGDYRVTEGCWVECESQVRVCGVGRLWEECGEIGGRCEGDKYNFSH